MKATELRIGNWVQVKVGKHTWKDYKVKPSTIEQISLSEEEFRPIPLTEEWSVKFEYECLLEMLVHLKDKSKYPIDMGCTDLDGMFVHEYQNLYFALTGEELTINNDTRKL